MVPIFQFMTEKSTHIVSLLHCACFLKRVDTSTKVLKTYKCNEQPLSWFLKCHERTKNSMEDWVRKKETKLNSAHSTHWKMREEKLEVLEGGPSFYDKKCVTRDRI